MAEKEPMNVDPELTKKHVAALEAASEHLAKEHKTEEASLLKRLSEQVATGKIEVTPSKGYPASPEYSKQCSNMKDTDGTVHEYCTIYSDDGNVSVTRDGQLIMHSV